MISYQFQAKDEIEEIFEETMKELEERTSAFGKQKEGAKGES